MKGILYIIIFTVVLSFGASAQLKPTTTEDPTTKFIRFYPNPAVNNITFEIQHDFDKSYTIQIYNFIGKKLVDLKAGSRSINLPLYDFYRGIYIYQLRDKSGQILESGKFQVIR